jgi:hypothetical protein
MGSPQLKTPQACPRPVVQEQRRSLQARLASRQQQPVQRQTDLRALNRQALPQTGSPEC